MPSWKNIATIVVVVFLTGILMNFIAGLGTAGKTVSNLWFSGNTTGN